MIKRIAQWLNRHEHKRIEVEAQARNEADERLLALLDVLAKKDKQLTAQLDLYNTLLNGVPVMIWYIESVDKMGICNKTCADFFGLDKPDQLSGTSLYDLMPTDEADICIANNKKVFNEYQTVCSEEWVTRHDGQRRLWHITKTPRGNGHVKYAVCCGIDITDQREAEWYRDALLRALPDLVFVHDADGYYLDCYAKENESLPYPCEVITGKHLSDCLPQAVVQKALVLFQEVLDTGKIGYIEYELSVGGEVKIFEARVVPLDEDRLLSTVRDITEWRKAQEALAKQLTAQQEALWRCEVAKDCPGNPDGICRKAERIGRDTGESSAPHGALCSVA